MKARLACAAIMLAALSSVASAVPPTREELAQWCGEPEDMAHCGRLIEQQQMKRLHSLARRDGVNLRIGLFPAGSTTFSDVENPLQQLSYSLFDSIDAIKLLNPKRVAPCHYDTWPPIAQDAAAWAERVRSHTAADPIVLQPGGQISL